ncbi:MAG: hypothetical protein BroJett021_45960 [Chloroflexota bacterium]|nr:MAG: hypothetical protein BroJett021_45960 [Chloroflexota bacterium]
MLHFTTLSHWMVALRDRLLGVQPAMVSLSRPPLSQLARLPVDALPKPVRDCPEAMKHLALLGDLDWEHFPERPTNRAWPGPTPAPRAPFVAAYLVKLEEHLRTFEKLREFLVNHPALVWVLGFPLAPADVQPWGFDAARSVPSRKQLGRVLRELDNAALQFLLAASVQCIADALPPDIDFGDIIALDTKHIIAWVKENNLKTFVRNRYDKAQRPKGDPDCRLGCKRKENSAPSAQDGDESRSAPDATPTTAGTPASETLPPLSKGEYYWGYASGVVVTKIEELAEVVLADLTQPFDQSDQSYFLPLMQRTENNLGRKPRFGALDKAYDAFYVYEYFHLAGGFAAVPWADRDAHRKTFSPEGLPLCEAGLPMPLKSTFWQKSNCLVPHEVGRYICPLVAQTGSATACPVNHPHAAKKGCITSLPTSPGNRVRHELDRQSQAFKRIYNQRSACERINSQALDLGIERPHLRNGRSIANINTLIYVLINLRALRRIRERLLQREAAHMLNV